MLLNISFPNFILTRYCKLFVYPAITIAAVRGCENDKQSEKIFQLAVNAMFPYSADSYGFQTLHQPATLDEG